MDHLKNILTGMAGTLRLFPAPRDYSRPTRDGFVRDAQNLRGDFAAVGRDMRTVLNRDEPPDYRTR